MFKKLHNQAKISFEIKPITPLLIQSGQAGLDPTLPDMRFVRTQGPLGNDVIFIPGSSLKGVIRSYVERILRTMGLRVCELGRCKGKYDRHCYACRIFGSITLSSRTRIVDAYPWRWDMNESECEKAIKAVMSSTMVRPGVAIDRRMGSAKSGSLFDFEVVTGGTFYGDIIIRNFQLWQLALILVALRDIDEGYQQLGYGKSRGLGRVSLKPSLLEIESYGHLAELAREGKIAGVGETEDRAAYNLIESDFVSYTDQTPEDTGLKTVLKIEETDKIKALLDAILKSDNWKNLLKKGR